MSDDKSFLALLKQCAALDYSIELVRCGPYSAQPFLCVVTGSGDGWPPAHRVYGKDVETIMRKAMEHVLARGFTQPQDIYGLRAAVEKSEFKQATKKRRKRR